MELFWLCQGFGIVLSVAAIFAYCHFTKRNFFAFSWKHLKSIMMGILVVLLIFSYAGYYKLSSEVTSEEQMAQPAAISAPTPQPVPAPTPKAPDVSSDTTPQIPEPVQEPAV